MGGSPEYHLACPSFSKYDANFSRMNQLHEIAPRECRIPDCEPKDITVEMAVEALKKFDIDYKAESKELGKVLDYQEDAFKNDQEK